MWHFLRKNDYLKKKKIVQILNNVKNNRVRHQWINEIRKVFIRRFPLSSLLAKTLRVNKIPMESFSKNLSFGVDFKLYFPLLMYKINTHNISGMRNYVNNPNWRIVMTNYVCMYILFMLFFVPFLNNIYFIKLFIK